MKKEMKRYECVSGYIIAEDGSYGIGDNVDDIIGDVQSIQDIGEDDAV